jgi:hypothetical protein
MGGAMLGQNRIVPGWVVVLIMPYCLMFFLVRLDLESQAVVFRAVSALLHPVHIHVLHLICPWCRHFGTSDVSAMGGFYPDFQEDQARVLAAFR